MILFDVNVLLNAHRSGQAHHVVARELLESVVNAPPPFAISESVLGAFVRIATHARAFMTPRTQARGSIVADAQHAALAIEHGCEWISFDRDFSRFPGLRWRHPLD